MRKFKLIVKACALIAYAFLLIIHFIVKDHYQLLQVFFYAFPLPILIFTGSTVTLLFYRTRTYFVLGICLILALVVYWFSTSYNFSNNTDIPKDASSILFWNAADGWDLPVDVLMESISSMKPDIIGLVEAEYATVEDIDLLSTTFPQYEFRILKGNMLVGVKGRIENVIFKAEERSYHINFIEAQLRNGRISVAITDIFQSPTMDKKKAIETVLQFASQKKTDLIIGDFNTPQESVHFKSFQTEYRSFHEYGQGFTATWPFGIPLLELDQIFAKKNLTPILLKKFYYPESDHGMLVGYIEEQF
ncbi:endonuclease/exonuclease/phosphatase family protein [Gelidibacter salicanalis]|uniref:Endonuclease/exonuclease/phosphatase family protein n=1 Tax=Gelidibacter salicanalis TaxID=291193 RepID=A0A934KMX7_9FLAO|nr:endonuclease/exonuclease/phosphatase family protein [Gelidibacter salicanalis]MBJ7880224.1 endonuclease/exonuclease/phosphatase family protein [Gelidibacter salicanalis]